MASFTSRIAGWTAGRLKGEKARKKTMDWMKKTGVGQLLGVAGDAALVSGALKGAGALKSLIAPAAGAGAPASASVAQRVFDPSRGGFVNVGGTAATAPAAGGMSGLLSGVGQRAASVGSGIMDFARRNPAIVQGVAGGAADVIGASMQAAPAARRVEMEEQELRRRQDEANRLAAMFMPRPRA